MDPNAHLLLRNNLPRRFPASVFIRVRSCWARRLPPLLLLALLATFTGCGKTETPLRRFNQVADFDLTERSGRKITRADLMGKILVVDFFFAGCSAECIALAQSLPFHRLGDCAQPQPVQGRPVARQLNRVLRVSLL